MSIILPWIVLCVSIELFWLSSLIFLYKFCRWALFCLITVCVQIIFDLISGSRVNFSLSGRMTRKFLRSHILEAQHLEASYSFLLSLLTSPSCSLLMRIWPCMSLCTTSHILLFLIMYLYITCCNVIKLLPKIWYNITSSVKNVIHNF